MSIYLNLVRIWLYKMDDCVVTQHVDRNCYVKRKVCSSL